MEVQPTGIPVCLSVCGMGALFFAVMVVANFAFRRQPERTRLNGSGYEEVFAPPLDYSEFEFAGPPRDNRSYKPPDKGLTKRYFAVNRRAEEAVRLYDQLHKSNPQFDPRIFNRFWQRQHMREYDGPQQRFIKDVMDKGAEKWYKKHFWGR